MNCLHRTKNKKYKFFLIPRGLLFYLFISISSLHADWSSSPMTLDQPSPNASSAASIVVDNLGNVTAAWLENNTGGTVVEASYYSINSNSWSTPTIIDQYNGGVSQPQLIVDKSGNVTAVWFEYLGGSYLVEAARFNGTNWTTVILDNGIQSPNAYIYTSPQMVVDGSGNVTVVWFEQQGSNYAVQAARFSGGAWTISPATLDGSNAYIYTSPQMVVDELGNVTVAWIEQQGSNYVVEAARFSGGAWTSAVILNNGIQTPEAYSGTTLQLTVDEYGNVTATWEENSTNPTSVQVTRFSAPPAVSGLSPNYGPVNETTSVIITGYNFATATAVNFGSTSAISFTVNSNTQITALSPASAAGTVDVTIVSAGLTSTTSLEDQFTFQDLFPPTNLTGYQQINRFLTQYEYTNILSWNIPSLGEIPTAYRIYRDASLTKLAGIVYYTGNQQLEFVDHNLKKGVVYSYYIVSVAAQGNMSEPASLVIQ